MTARPTNATYLDGNRGRLRLPGWRWDALRTTLWVVPVILIVVAGLLFVLTFEIDLAAFHHRLTLPAWVRTGSADAGRQVLIAIAAAIITTVGVVFSITILALTLASQQFGPRMMRNFIRDLGNQVTPRGLRRHLRVFRFGSGLYHWASGWRLRSSSYDHGCRGTASR